MCEQVFYGSTSLMEHRCKILHEDVAQAEHQFGWLTPLPGLLHVEMNACKAFFDLNWEVSLKDICSSIGCKTPKAMECIRRCYDNHKTFQIIEMLYIALTDELLTPYVRYCYSVGIEATVAGYWFWSDNVEDPNYLYIQQMVLTFIHSIMLFRTGMRRGDYKAIISGRETLSLLFFGRNHPKYQIIMTINRFIETMMPDNITEIVKSSLTLSRTGNMGHFQGGDACLEEINKEAKTWVTKGVPSEKEWLKIFRNLDKLSQVII
jgi:hypothetical protein